MKSHPDINLNAYLSNCSQTFKDQIILRLKECKDTEEKKLYKPKIKKSIEDTSEKDLEKFKNKMQLLSQKQVIQRKSDSSIQNMKPSDIIEKISKYKAFVDGDFFDEENNEQE